MDSFLGAVQQFFQWAYEGLLLSVWAVLVNFFTTAAQTISFIVTQIVSFMVPSEIYTLIARWVFLFLSIMIVGRCILSLLSNRSKDRVWGYLWISDNNRIPLMHWENSIGRSKLSDVVVNLPFISRSHAVLSFCDGEWSLADLGSKGGVGVNGNRISRAKKVRLGDKISLAGAEFVLLPPDQGAAPDSTERLQGGVWYQRIIKHFLSGKAFPPGKTFMLIILFQFLGGIQLLIASGAGTEPRSVFSYLLFIFVESVYYVTVFKISKTYLDLILLAYFLCGLDLLLVTSAAPELMYKQVIAIILGIIVFSVLQYLIKDLVRAQKLRYVLMAGAILLMILNLTVGETRNGAKNWIDIGFTTFQPMEFVKVAFVIAGAATLDRLLTTRNLTSFIGFSGACVAALVLMRDLGTAVIFFGAFLVIAFMRSGDIRTIAFISAVAVLGAFAVVNLRPYIAARFSVWGHVWEFANSTGYQQTRTMMAAASGGLLGVGGGNGYLVKVPAANTDLVFGMVCEEWGLIIALIAVAILIFMAIFSVLMMRSSRSSFYAIAACGAASLFMIQSALNIFGSMDILPLTGVTLPFISNGGSSMIVSWALLALIKSADERIRPGAEKEEEKPPNDYYRGDEEDELVSQDDFDENGFFEENGWLL